MSSTTLPPEFSAPSDPPPLGAGFDFTDPRSPLATYYLQTSHVLAFALIAIVFVLLCFVPLWHTDIWGHLKFGQWIFDHGQLPTGEPFTPHGDPGLSATHHGWFSQTLLYLAYHAGERMADGDRLERMAGGVEMLRFTHALLAALRCVVLFLAFRRASGSPAAACWALAITVVLSVGNLAIARPQVLGELCFAILLCGLSRPVMRLRTMLVLPLLFVVWANAHGSFLTGLLLLSFAALGRALDGLATGTSRSLVEVIADAQLRRLGLVLAASIVGVAVLNPAGPTIFRDVLSMAAHPNVVAMDEWQPLRFVWAGGGHWAYLIIVGLLIGTQLASARWFTASTLVVILVFGVQPLLHQRMLIWWLMLAPWLMVRYWPDCDWGWLSRWNHFESVPSLRKTMIAAALGVVAVLWSIPVQWLLAGKPQPLERSVSAGTAWKVTRALLDPALDPAPETADLVQELRRRTGGQAFQGGIFASETLGDFFVWELAPRVPVFIYTHVHEFSPEHWQECVAVRSAASNWKSILDRHRVQLVAVEPTFNAKLCQLLRDDKAWRVVVDEADATSKRDPRTRLFVALRKETNAVPSPSQSAAKR